MYETHFGFHRQPFQSADACRAFFVSESIRDILPQLIHALRSDLGVAVLTGVPGSGKTSLLRHIQQQLSSDGRVVVCSGANLGTSSDLIGVLLQASRLTGGSDAGIKELAVNHMPQASRAFAFDHIKRTAELWGPILLLIDDAQLIPLSVLNELRACTEVEWNGRNLVRCLVSAPISFEEQLARTEYAEFSRRIRCHAFLQPLKSSESIRFLKEQIELVGGQLFDVFTATALEFIATAADGIPRCLGLLADESLVVAAAAGENIATEQSVRVALSRLQHLQYNWNASPHKDVADETSMQAEPEEFEAIHPFALPDATPTAVAVAKRPHSSVQATLAPGVIEFGGPAMTSTRNSRAQSLINGASEVEVSAAPVEQPRASSLELTEGFQKPEEAREIDAIEVQINIPETELRFSSVNIDDVDAFNKESKPHHAIVEFGGSWSESEAVADLNPKSSVTVFREFEVGRRFISESSQESISVEDVRDCDILSLLNQDGQLDFEAALCSFELPLAEFGATDMPETKIVWFGGNGDEPATSTATHKDEFPARSADYVREIIAKAGIEQFAPIDAGSTTDEMLSEQAPSDLHLTNSNGLFDISRTQLSNRMPVFDRFTWIALGRDVPSGSNPVVSATRTNRLLLAEDGMLPMPQRIAVTTVPACAGQCTSIDQIPVTQTDDLTLMDELRRSSSGKDSGLYVAIRRDCAVVAEVEIDSRACTKQIDVQVTTEISDAKGHSTSFTEVRPACKTIGDSDEQAESTANRPMQSQTEALPTSHLRIWQDGMLVFPERAGLEAEKASDLVLENEAAVIIEEGDMDRLESEPADVAAVEQMPARPTTVSQSSITLGPGGFFTLPVSDQKHDGDLQTIGISEHEDVFPFVEAFNSLRADVRVFQNSGFVTAADSDGTPRPSTPASERFSSTENLISQAKRRLDHQETQTDCAASSLQMPPELHRPEASLNAIESVSMADAAMQEGKTPQFARLFTRLWENRKRQADQFEKRQDRVLTSGCVSEDC